MLFETFIALDNKVFIRGRHNNKKPVSAAISRILRVSAPARRSRRYFCNSDSEKSSSRTGVWYQEVKRLCNPIVVNSAGKGTTGTVGGRINDA